MSPSVTEYLRVEHGRLQCLLETARETAEGAESVSPDELAERVDRVLQIVYDELLPQLEAEQATLYPVVARITKSDVPGDLLTTESLAVGKLARQLLRARARLGGADCRDEGRLDLRRALYDIHFAVRSHLAKEDDVLLPLIDRHLSRREDRKLLEELRGASEEARRIPAIL